MEIIFVSSDEDEHSFDEYYAEMPWWKLDFQQREKKEELASRFEVNGIPKFILLDGDEGTILCSDAREQIQSRDKRGEHFPWNHKEEKTSSSCILL